MEHVTGEMKSHVGGVFKGPEKFVNMPLSFVGYADTELARWVKMKYAGRSSNDTSFGLQQVRVGEMELIA